MQRIVAKMQRLFSQIVDIQQHTHGECRHLKDAATEQLNFYSPLSSKDWQIKAPDMPGRGRLFFDLYRL